MALFTSKSKALKKLEAKLSPLQIKAAKLIVMNEFLPRGGYGIPEEERQKARDEGRIKLTYEDIAKKTGCCTKTLYTWRHTDEDFIEYVNKLSTTTFMSNLPRVMNKHLDMVLKGHGSMKGIELFYKFGGLLVDKQEVTSRDESSDQTLEERLAKLKARGNSSNDGGQ